MEPPAQLGVFTDGDALSVITQYEGERGPLTYLDFTTQALPYHLLKHPRVLILGAGGGADVLLALYHRVPKIDAVEINPQMVELVKEEFADFSGGLYNKERVDVYTTEARSFVTRNPRNEKEKYNLIQVALLDSFSASSAGLYALHENYLYTVEAFEDYLNHLQPGGFLAVTRWLRLPPRESLKLFATALEALKQRGVTHPERQLALIRSWKMTTLLVKKGVLTKKDKGQIRTFCEKRSFDVVYYPGVTEKEINHYNKLNQPYFFEGTQAILGEDKKSFFENYKFHITPATDNHPYFFHFFKWRFLPEILKLKDVGGMSLLEWGYPVLVATLLQALVLSLVLILLPLWLKKRVAVRRKGWSRVILYFLTLGLAFLFIEIAFIQRFILFLGHPLYAIAVVLSAFLIFAGLGSGFSSRLAQRFESKKSIKIAVVGIILIALLDLFILPVLFHWLLPLPEVLRILITILLIAPLAFLMGMPFPLGLSLVGGENPDWIPWAWGINGCASVLSALLATLLAVHFGFVVVVLMALGLYGVSAFSLSRMESSRS